MTVSFIFKIALVFFLFFIIINLAKALFIIAKGDQPQKPLSHFLGRRVMLSAAVVLLLLLALFMGWITPNPRPY